MKRRLLSRGNARQQVFHKTGDYEAFVRPLVALKMSLTCLLGRPAGAEVAFQARASTAFLASVLRR